MKTKAPRFTSKKNKFASLALVTLQALSTQLPGEWRVGAHVAIAAAQAAIAALAHYRNPDGSPASEPFIPSNTKEPHVF
jgi:hypothetical protein